ncbi:MAG: aminotransferase class I/II-fold pyridoxal phosphate-dependent enzyme, partial [Balneolia bacterium]|nr:aminotransferase class I/II-fold pyridoxal phosphate-dependent enzyme [Balneolia bacterium]
MRLQRFAGNRPVQNYEIRGIVEKAFSIQSAGMPVFWENIGDPVQKGLQVPDWMKGIVSRATMLDSSYGYCDSKGIPVTRTFLSDRTNRLGGNRIEPKDITFFNGLGDAIARVYGLLPTEARVLMPSPTYPAHSGAEASRTGRAALTYTCRPENGWLPDLAEVSRIAEENPNVCALLIINPDNPTGAVWPKPLLEGMVEIAQKHGLFIICDEIYENILYECEMTRLAEVIGCKVPAIVMKGISKEFPWPGSRCGWLEYHNRDACSSFDSLCVTIDHGKMTEVCSTTLPQLVIPEIMTHEDYLPWRYKIQGELSEKMTKVREMVRRVPGFSCAGGGGAFYAAIHMDNPETFGLPKEEISAEKNAL